MIVIFKAIRFKMKLRQAVKAAINAHEADGRKYLVIILKGEPTCVAKSTLRKMIAQGACKKGVTLKDFEQKALFISK